MDKSSKLLLPAVILIASTIFGGFYYASEISKQNFAEKQRAIEVQQAEKLKQANSLLLDTCLEDAEKEADEGIQVALDNAVGVQANSLYKTIDDLKKQRDKDKDVCFKRYTQR